MRRIILLFFASCASNTEPAIIADILAFEKVWTPFLFKLSGCEMKRSDNRTCDPRMGYWDYALFLKSRQKAQKLFDLKAAQ